MVALRSAVRNLFVCLGLILHSARSESGSTLFAGVSDTAAALALLEEKSVAPSQDDVLYALEHGWWDAATKMLRQMRQQGEAVGSMQEVRSAATRIRDQATDVINLLRVGANKEETVVSCAFQWAQRPDFIYLNVKFSSRIDGPVTVLNVDNEEVNLTNDSVAFSAIGRQKPKKFQLNLSFMKEIIPEQSYWSFASVGRLSFTFAKAVNETWPRLLMDKKSKPKNMHHWYERQVTLDAEVKKEAEDKRKRREEEDKEKKRREDAEKATSKGSGTAPSPPSPPRSDPPGGDAADTSSEPSSVKPKKKSKKKKGGGKEEL